MYDVITIGQSLRDAYLISKRYRIVRDKRFITSKGICFPFGEKIELDDMLFEIGGGATNTAVTFARQGLKTAIISKIGTDPLGQEVKKEMKERGISTTLFVHDAKQRTGFTTFFFDSSGERTAFVYRGASLSLTASQIPWSKVHAKWFYISSLAGNIELLKKVVQFAKRKKIKVALNPGGMELKKSASIKNILRDIDVLLLNRSEGARLLKVPFRSEKKIVKGLDSICNGIAVVTEGEKGSWVCDGKTVRKINIKAVKAVDTTGAGDAYGSGFVAGMVKRPGDFDYALRLATINSASVVQQVGAKNGLLTRRLPKGKRWMNIHVTKV